MRPLRVLWCIKGLGPGGAERLLVTAAKHHDRERFDFEVAYVLPHKDHLVGELEAAGVATHCIAGTSRAGWPWALRQLVRRGHYDVVHLHSPLVAAAARTVLLSLGRSRPPTVSTQHNVWDSFALPTRWVNRLTLSADRRVVAVSEVVRQSMGRASKEAETIVHGVPLDELEQARARRGQIREELGVGADDVLVCTVANLRATKAYPDLLEAAREVTEARPNVVFVAVGQGPLADELDALRLDMGLGDRFRFLGYRPDATAVAAAADLFALSSVHEGFPIAVMEALAVGTPVVATRVGGVPDAFEHGVAGLIVPPSAPSCLAQAILQLVDDPTQRNAMSKAARQCGVQFSTASAVARWEAIYSDVNAGVVPRRPCASDETGGKYRKP